MNLFKGIFLLLLKLLRLKFIEKQRNSILLVAEYGKNGGTRTYFISLLKLLKEQGYEVTILDNSNLHDFEIERLVDQLQFHWHTVNFDFWCINFRQIPAGVNAKEMLIQLVRELLFWISVLQSGRFSKLVFSVSHPGMYIHTIILPIQYLYILHSPIQHYCDSFTRLYLRLFLNKRKQILTVSKSALEDVFKYWFNSHSVEYIHFVYNFYIPKYDVIKKKYKHDSLIVLTIGSLENYKNPYFFIEVAKKVIKYNPSKKVQFLWAGSGSLLHSCKDQVNGFPEIIFLGDIENVEALYVIADIYFQPSLLESHGIAVLGAMYFSLPCVVSDKGGLKESISHKVNGFIDEMHDSDIVAREISMLLLNKEMNKSFGQMSKSIFESKFNHDLWKKNMLKFL